MPRPGRRVLLLGGDADHNVGDRAIRAALIDCLLAHDPATEIAVVGDPALPQGESDVAATIRRGPAGLARLFSAARRADRILIAGGGLFQDDDSRAKMPYWAARLGLLRAGNRRIAALAIGAGPLRHPESRLAARLACSAVQRLSVRDRLAQQALAGCTSRPIEVVPDPAFLLQPAARAAAEALIRAAGLAPDRPLIVATLRHWFHQRGGFVPNAVKSRCGRAPRRDQARFAALQDAIAGALADIARPLGAGVLLLPGYNVRHEADDVACAGLVGRLPGVPVKLVRIADPRLYQAVLGCATLVVAARMHPLILAATMGVPFVGLGYNPKFDGLYDLLGLASRPLPLDRFPAEWDAAALVAAADAALQARIDLRARAQALADATRREVIAAVFGPAPAAPAAPPPDPRVARLMAGAARHVGLYRDLYGGLADPPLPRDAPLLDKARLRATPFIERQDRRRRGRALTAELSSGSSGEPLTVHSDRRALWARRGAFLRALLACGYRPGQRGLLLTSRRHGQRRTLARWHYADLAATTSALAVQLAERDPQLLYGPLSTLELLADAAAGRPPRSLRLVVSTAEQLTRERLARLERGFGVPVADFYGLTEFGLVAYRRPGARDFRLARSSLVLEFLPVPGDAAVEQLVITDLAERTCPLIRYDTGDLVCRDQARAGRPIVGFAGRAFDCIVLPDGSRLSPYQIDLAIERLPSLRAFEVVQQPDLSIDVTVDVPAADAELLCGAIAQQLAGLLGRATPYRVVAGAVRRPASGTKFRPIRSFAGARA